MFMSGVHCVVNQGCVVCAQVFDMLLQYRLRIRVPAPHRACRLRIRLGSLVTRGCFLLLLL